MNPLPLTCHADPQQPLASAIEHASTCCGMTAADVERFVNVAEALVQVEASRRPVRRLSETLFRRAAIELRMDPTGPWGQAWQRWAVLVAYLEASG